MPLLGSSKYYNGDFKSLIEPNIGSRPRLTQVLSNMNKASAIRLKNLNGITPPDSLLTTLGSQGDPIPDIPHRSKVRLKMSTIGFSDDRNECVIIADQIYGIVNQTRFIYYFQKNVAGMYLPVEKKIIAHFDPNQVLDIGTQKKKE